MEQVPSKRGSLIADLDEIQPPLGIVKVVGQEFELRPITGNQLRALDDAHKKVQLINAQLGKGDVVSWEVMLEAWFEFCSIVMPTLTMDHVSKMTTRQVSELLSVCFNYATNQEYKHSTAVESEKKKKILSQSA